jgi:RHS repeat-associated protein
LTDHLGNVRVVLNDARNSVGLNSITAAYDYYPGGMMMPGRTFSDGYRYGFNGKEKDPEGMGGGGSTYDYGFRIYNPRIGKFLSVDPLYQSYPWLTPYQFASNRPIIAIDIDGLESNDVNGENVGSDPNETAIKNHEKSARLAGVIVVTIGVFEKRVSAAMVVLSLSNQADIKLLQNKIGQIEKKLEKLSPGSTKPREGGQFGGGGSGGRWESNEPMKPRGIESNKAEDDPKATEIKSLQKELAETKGKLNSAEFKQATIENFTITGQLQHLAKDIYEAWEELSQENKDEYMNNLDKLQDKVLENTDKRLNYEQKRIENP